jgi:2-oxoglutarate ferredoxin oxidoreductase subunit beta
MAQAVALGAKLANPELSVIVTVGDGDAFGAGLGQLVHNMRRNADLTCLVMDNQVLGLTGGQPSPTAVPRACERAVNPLALALVSGASFVARAYSGEAAAMAEVFAKAIRHEGFSLVDCLSPCVTYDKVNTYERLAPRVYQLEAEGHDAGDLRAALDKAYEAERVPLGVFYEKLGAPGCGRGEPAVARFGPPVKQPLGLTPEQGEALKNGFR